MDNNTLICKMFYYFTKLYNKISLLYLFTYYLIFIHMSSFQSIYYNCIITLQLQ